MQTKVCTLCFTEKPATNEFFRKNADHKYGLYSRCKICEHKIVTQYVKTHRENVEKWRKITESRKLGIIPPKYKITLEEQKIRRLKSRNIRNTLPKIKVRHNIDLRIKQFLKKGGVKKYTTLENILPFKISELKTHLESQFRDGMNWENYTKLWVIDHIIPVDKFSFDSYDSPEIKKCWSLENLQPLLIFENCIKSNKIIQKGKLPIQISSICING